MKKVLLAFDGNNFSHSIMEFAKLMHSRQPIFAIGFFLPAVDYAELLYSFGGIPSGPIYITEAVPGNAETQKENVAVGVLDRLRLVLLSHDRLLNVLVVCTLRL